MWSSAKLAGLIITALACVEVQVVASVIPSDSHYAVSLNGKWRIKMEQVKSYAGHCDDAGYCFPIETPEHFESFYAPDYQETSGWQDISVPGNWEMTGLSPATYHQPDNSSAFYRKEFVVPAAWAGRIVKINFDGVQNGAEVWLNGEPVDVTEPSWGRSNYHESGWTAWQADLTPRVKFGQKNLLALRVTKNTKTSNLDSGDYFFLGGIYRPVTLFSIPKVHIEDIAVRTRLKDDGTAEVKLIAEVQGMSDGKLAVSLQLGDYPAMEAHPDMQGHAEITQIIPHPKLWSAEFPNRYLAVIELKDADGRTTEHIQRWVGIREITIKDGIFMVNGTQVKMAGICRHDCYAPVGTAVGEDLWRKDLELMKKANINAIRTSHYPYGSGFYDLCDEMGFYVVDELPYCWCPTDNKELESGFLQRARETVARDKNHPCIVMWTIGNENRQGHSYELVADLVKQMDPTRPRVVSCLKADLNGVDMDDDHYTAPAAMIKDAEDKERRAKWPMIYLENPNVWDTRLGADYGCLDLWSNVIERTWNVTMKYDGICGLFPWEWQDRAVMDKNSIKPYWYDPETGIQYLKTKGIVDGLRNPRPQYYHIKMVFSPIKVDSKIDVSASGIAELNITNSYSFTDLSQLNIDWTLLSKGRALKSGREHLALAPRSSGRAQLKLPADVVKRSDSLRMDFNDPRGWNVVSYQFPLAEQDDSIVTDSAFPKDLKTPKLNLVVNRTIGDRATWQRIYRYDGELINIKTEPADAAFANSLDADIVLEPDPRNAPESDYIPNNPNNRSNSPALGVVVGHVHADLADGEFKYKIDWAGEKADIQELGWTFEMPKSFDNFSWKRQSRWSVYPETHIGRPAGIAHPDSANVRLTHITRPDAFDFNSTKYDCDWAALTDSKGHGLCIQFAANSRHHARGGFAANGDYTLTINKQCSPPRDISTSVVRDLYLELKSGDTVEGSFKIARIIHL